MTEAVLAPEDDLFWLQRAGAIVTGTAAALDNAARRLADAMAWFWTAYAAVALVVVTGTDGINGVGTAVVVAVPAVLVFAAYLSATFATLPIQVNFDDRAPDSIKAAHELVMKRRRRRIEISAVLAALAALSVAAAVSLIAVTRGQDRTDVAVFNISDTRILAGGQVDEVKQVTVRLVDPKGGLTERVVPVANGSWDTTFPLAISGIYEVSAIWTIDEVRHSVAEKLDWP